MKYKKSLALTIIGVLAPIWSLRAIAQPILTLEEYLEQCVHQVDNDELNPECERLQEANEAELDDADEPIRERRRSPRTRSETKSTGISGYAGATLGVFFPDIDESRDFFTGSDTEIDDAAVGSSIYGGIRFNRYLAADLELSGFIGGVDSELDEDENYTLGAFFLNPRFTFPLGEKQNSLALFLSPGIGVSQLTSTVEDEVGDFDRTTLIEDDVRFSWQVKGGVSVPVSSKFSILSQVRYASQTGDDAIDYLGAEIGVNFDF